MVFVLEMGPELVHAVKEDAAIISTNNANNFFMAFLLRKNEQTALLSFLGVDLETRHAFTAVAQTKQLILSVM